MPVSQFSDPTLSAEEALSACGPAASLAFAQANGRNPTLREALDLAKHVGWSVAGGMNGFQNQVRLMGLLKQRGLVGDFEAAATPDWNRVTAEAQSGRPVTISTPHHYFTVSGYDPAKGYYVGTSGTDLKGGEEWMTAKGGKEWMTADEIASYGRGAPNGVMYMARVPGQGPLAMTGQPTQARQKTVEANTELGLVEPPAGTRGRRPPEEQPAETAGTGEQPPAVGKPADPNDPLRKWLMGQEALSAFSRRLMGQMEATPTDLPRYTLPGLPKIDLGWGSPYRLGAR